MDSKDQLRKIAKELRKQIKNKKEKELIITNRILENKYVLKAKDILIYIALPNEVETIYLIEKLFKLNKNIYIPRVCGKKIKFYKLESLKELKKSKLGIMEPTGNKEFINKVNSVCIIPGLLFDKENNRLGYGGGYYDRFLSENKIYKIGICFSTFIVDKILKENHDIKMDLVITEK